MSIGVLVMTYGTPASREEIEAYYSHIRHGRAPTPEQLLELTSRYDAIGGLSPLNACSRSQVAALQSALERLAPDDFVVAYGTKHAQPSIEDGIGQLATTGCKHVVGLVLAPHYSALGVGEYIEQARAAAEGLGLSSAFLERWGTDDVLVELLAERVRDSLSGMSSESDAVEVLFSAHSLPERIIAMGDPYADEVAATADAIASQCGLSQYRLAWQSAARTGEAWLGPDIGAVIDETARQQRSGVLLCPVGFTSDHLEILYDLDIVTKQHASDVGLEFARTPSLNDNAALFGALGLRVVQIAEHAWPHARDN